MRLRFEPQAHFSELPSWGKFTSTRKLMILVRLFNLTFLKTIPSRKCTNF
jgi:hypothetical protein